MLRSDKETENGGGEKRRGYFSDWLPLPAEDALVLEQNELHDLVLVHHVDRYVSRLSLGPQQRGSKHDGHALSGHTIGLPMFNHPGETERNEPHEHKLQLLMNQDIRRSACRGKERIHRLVRG